MIVVALLGLSLIAIGLRELLRPHMMPEYVESLRQYAQRDDYSKVQKIGGYILAWGILLLTFCWHHRARGFWFIISLGMILYGALYIMIPDQSLDLLKRLYFSPPLYLTIGAGIKMAAGVALLASIRLNE